MIITSFSNTLAIIPVCNEEATIARVVHSLQKLGINCIRVVDNGSSDSSATRAREAGAEVLWEPISGYGRACWRGLQQLPPEIEWILFCDGDGSDDISHITEFLAQRQDCDFILGDRTATVLGRQVLTPVQHFGNRLATWLLKLGWGYRYRDLGPLRLIRRSSLEQMQMQDRGFGWTLEMQVKAVKNCLRICEIPVNYHLRQGGKSKISGNITGSIKAGTVILMTLVKLYWQKFPIFPAFPAFLLILGSLLILPYGDFRQVTAVPHFYWGIGVMGVGFLLSWGLNSLSGLWFWAVTLLSRLFLLPMYPSDDVWRYLWEGYIQLQGFSPYHLPPDAIQLLPYRTEWWHLLNHPGVSAIYPPVAQWGFRLLAAISPSVILFKLAFVIADLAICWLLCRRFGFQKTLLYAWNPLVIYIFAGGAHYDSWFILPLVASWFFFDRKERINWSMSALLLGISAAIKWISLPILIFLVWQAWRRVSWRLTLLVSAIGLLPLIISAIPFCQQGECPLIPTGSDFVVQGRSAEFLPYLLGFLGEEARSVNWIYFLPLALVVIFLLNKTKQFQQFAEGYFFALLIFSPIVHAWYFTWIVPFAVATQNLGVRLASLSVFCYFLLPYRQALGDSSWYLSNWERYWLWLPFICGYFWTRK